MTPPYSKNDKIRLDKCIKPIQKSVYRGFFILINDKIEETALVSF